MASNYAAQCNVSPLSAPRMLGPPVIFHMPSGEGMFPRLGKTLTKGGAIRPKSCLQCETTTANGLILGFCKSYSKSPLLCPSVAMTGGMINIGYKFLLLVALSVFSHILCPRLDLPHISAPLGYILRLPLKKHEQMLQRRRPNNSLPFTMPFSDFLDSSKGEEDPRRLLTLPRMRFH